MIRMAWRCLDFASSLGHSPPPWCGAVAQLGERVVRNDEVSGSIPLSSTRSPQNAALSKLMLSVFVVRSLPYWAQQITWRGTVAVAIEYGQADVNGSSFWVFPA